VWRPIEQEIAAIAELCSPLCVNLCVQAAYTRPDVWRPIEQDIAAFAADTSRKRHVLEPMSASQQRALAHELAEAYGMATISTG